MPLPTLNPLLGTVVPIIVIWAFGLTGLILYAFRNR